MICPESGRLPDNHALLREPVMVPGIGHARFLKELRITNYELQGAMVKEGFIERAVFTAKTQRREKKYNWFSILCVLAS